MNTVLASPPLSPWTPVSQPSAGIHDRVATTARVVIKVGTNVVMRDDGRLAVARLHAITESIAALRAAHRDVVLVSSGAIGLGMQRLGIQARPAELALTQACAAVGQGRLIARYADAFDQLDVVSAQVLVTEDDFTVVERSQNLRATLTTLLAIGVVPIVNENDTVSTIELERLDIRDGDEPTRQPVFGDNDKLSALIATHVNADLLVLLSDVDGMYTANPAQVADATCIPVVERITPTLLAAANGGGARGRGGMATKVDAARIATQAGICTVIANGRMPGIIDAVCAGRAIGTLFLPEVSQ